MPGEGSAKRRSLAEADRTTLNRLHDADLPASLRAHMESLLNYGMIVNFEREGIPIYKVWEKIASVSHLSRSRAPCLAPRRHSSCQDKS